MVLQKLHAPVYVRRKKSILPFKKTFLVTPNIDLSIALSATVNLFAVQDAEHFVNVNVQ